MDNRTTMVQTRGRMQARIQLAANPFDELGSEHEPANTRQLNQKLNKMSLFIIFTKYGKIRR